MQGGGGGVTERFNKWQILCDKTLLLYYCKYLLLSELQRVQNCAARLILRAARRARVTPLLHPLLWLPVEQRVGYNHALLCFKVITEEALVYLSGRLLLYNPPLFYIHTRVFRIQFNTRCALLVNIQRTTSTTQKPWSWGACRIPYYRVCTIGSKGRQHLLQDSVTECALLVARGDNTYYHPEAVILEILQDSVTGCALLVTIQRTTPRTQKP